MFEIDKSVPLTKDARGRKQIFPVDEMEAGDSFLIPTESKDHFLSARSVASKNSKNGKVFTTRTVDGGLRVWRTK